MKIKRGNFEAEGKFKTTFARQRAQCAQTFETYRDIQTNIVELDGRAKSKEHRASEDRSRPLWGQRGLAMLWKAKKEQVITNRGNE